MPCPGFWMFNVHTYRTVSIYWLCVYIVHMNRNNYVEEVCLRIRNEIITWYWILSKIEDLMQNCGTTYDSKGRYDSLALSLEIDFRVLE